MVNSNQYNTEILADPQEDQVPQTSIKVVAARSKAKAKPENRETVVLPSTIPTNERKWIDIEPSKGIAERAVRRVQEGTSAVLVNRV